MCNVPASRKAATNKGGPQLAACHFPLTASPAQCPSSRLSACTSTPASAPLGSAQNTFQNVGRPFAPQPNLRFEASQPAKWPKKYTAVPATTDTAMVHAS